MAVSVDKLPTAPITLSWALHHPDMLSTALLRVLSGALAQLRKDLADPIRLRTLQANVTVPVEMRDLATQVSD